MVTIRKTISLRNKSNKAFDKILPHKLHMGFVQKMRKEELEC
jgi:hypothetical protein